MRKKRVIVDLYFKRGKYLLYLINERVKSGERREDVIKDIYVFCPSLEAMKIAINTIGLDPDHVIKYISIFNNDLDGYIKWLKEMIEIDKLGLNRVIRDDCELFCIQNPPYSGSLHLDFFEVGIDLITKFNGKMVIIEPATWLINIRKKGTAANKHDDIKKRIEGHVESVVIENLNKEFNTGLYIPFAITTIDMSKTFDTINYNCCGECKNVKTIYDCNLIGSYEDIWSIFNKTLSYKDMMKSHITKDELDSKNICYAKYDQILPFGIEPAKGNKNLGRSNASKNDNNYIETIFGEFSYNYIQSSFHRIVGITTTIPKKLKGGSNYANPVYSDTNADCVYGTQAELENWKHFIFNNKLSLFINIVLTISQNNNSKEFLPWLVDKQYTDDEINKLFGFTDEEIKLIDSTIKKYERNSPWFKRYMCGKDAATDDEVTEYIKKITEKC